MAEGCRRCPNEAGRAPTMRGGGPPRAADCHGRGASELQGRRISCHARGGGASGAKAGGVGVGLRAAGRHRQTGGGAPLPRLAASRREIDRERRRWRPVAARADGRSQQIRGLICKNL